jgi:hypothetical protein
VVVEAVAPGGQAGTTSMIENYLGFHKESAEANYQRGQLRKRGDSARRFFSRDALLTSPAMDRATWPTCLTVPS